jgi:hydroxyethylthiazole kinase
MFDFITPLENVRNKEPLVQCITNFVTVNDCANIILAAGGSPSMSQDIREVEESVCRSAALVCNMGAIDFTESMILAGKKANSLGIPVVLDPVAAGGTTLRRKISKRLLKEVHFTAIRGNASEIRYLAGEAASGSGVDVAVEDVITDENISGMVEIAARLAVNTGSIIAVSGPIDIITDGEKTVLLRNGCATMARITGSGCMLTSLIGAFCGSNREDYFSAVCCAMAVMGISGEMAEKKRLKNGTGNATFRTDLIDAVFNMNSEELSGGIRDEIYERRN